MSLVPARVIQGNAVRRISRQTRGCPRNCRRKAFAQNGRSAVKPLEKSGKAGERRSIREPGDLPETIGNLEQPSGGGQKDTSMVTNSAATAVSVSTSKIIPLGMSAILGLFMVGFVGFSHLEVVHNAAHDTRHSLAFPCH
jgi:cobalt transporter subunit CbtB